MGAALAWLVAACGSGGSGTVAQGAQQTLSSKATTSLDQTGASKTTADPGTTSTVTEPARTTTVTKTKTETAPAVTKTQTETVPAASGTTQTNKVVIAPTSTTPENGSETAVPWWGWVLIALGAIGLLLGVFWAGHRHGQHCAAQPPVQAGAGPYAPGGQPGPGAPQPLG